MGCTSVGVQILEHAKLQLHSEFNHCNSKWIQGSIFFSTHAQRLLPADVQAFIILVSRGS